MNANPLHARLADSARLVARLCRLVALSIAIAACAGPKVSRGVKWTDPDMKDIPKPQVAEEYAVWDFMDHSLFYPLGTLLNL